MAGGACCIVTQAGTFSIKSHASLIWLKTNGLEQVNVMGPEGVQRMKVGEHPLAIAPLVCPLQEFAGGAEEWNLLLFFLSSLIHPMNHIHL